MAVTDDESLRRLEGRRFFLAYPDNWDELTEEDQEPSSRYMGSGASSR